MGGSSSSSLDESKCTYIRGKTEAVIKNFSPHYKRQYVVSFCKHIQNEQEQDRDPQAQFLKTKPPVESSTIFYEGEALHFAEDLKKWKDRYVVINNNYAVESFDSKEAFQKGMSSKSCIVPVGGKVLTTEEEYNRLSDKHFPDPAGSNGKENAQAFIVLPKEFPVYLWQPFLRHHYFCFPDPEAQKKFSAALNDSIRHSNHDFFKQSSFEAEAFLEAVQFFRQEKGHYGSWEMITGNEVQILSNLVMEELLPNLQTMLLPKMKGKRNDRKRLWFSILEETYLLVQDQVSEGLRTLKEECKEVTTSLEGNMRSNMDQIVTSKNFVADKIKANISEPVHICCGESIQPFLASILEELMGPVSSGFSEVRSLFEKEVSAISQNFQATNDITKLKEDVDHLMGLPYNSVKMELCYQKVNPLQEKLQDLKNRFKVYDVDMIIQRTQNIMQELLENAVYTFEQLLDLNHPRDTAKMATAIEKVKLRVLKQFDYDSSTVRKKIFQDALVQISLPTLQRTLASSCKLVLQEYEQYIFAEQTNVIQVENVYEEILLQMLLKETLKVIKEAAHLKKHNLYEEMTLPSESVSSLSDLKTPLGSAQSSPARKQITSVSSDTAAQSSEVPTAENSVQDKAHETSKLLDLKEEISVSDMPTEAKEEGIISDLHGNQESPTVLPGVFTEETTPQPSDVVESTLDGSTRREEKVPGEEENRPVCGDVNEIRNLLTLTMEVPVAIPPENKEKVLHECEISEVQEHAEKMDQEDKAKERQACEMQEPVLFPPSEKPDEINIMSISEEARYIPHKVPSEVLDLCQTSREELETQTSMSHADVSPDDPSQTKSPDGNGPSGQREAGPSLLKVGLPDQKPQVEQHAEREALDGGQEGPSSLQAALRDDNFQAGQKDKEDSPEAELSLLQSVLAEVGAPSFSGRSEEMQESILNIANMTIEPTGLPVSVEVKESEGSPRQLLVNMDSTAFTFAQGDDPGQTEASLSSVEAANSTEGETEKQENVEDSCPQSQFEN
ncbi:protein Niban 1 isoform X1 [Varanus komodoensis]|uniref:Niban apoptosis regulator 1 n=1 Tax=Varanus komodoensis TaxID=61221 RepID=A0A8D2KT84_VARKO|nr:protein Niban 1 isoform X1 [Varanus komodoensis]